MGKKEKQKRGIYIEVVGYGHGAHEIFGAWDVPLEKVEDLDALIKSRPDLFTIRQE